MNQDQDNQTTAFETTNTVLDENSAIWSGIPVFADAAGRVGAGLEEIRSKQGKQAMGGETQTKKDACRRYKCSRR